MEPSTCWRYLSDAEQWPLFNFWILWFHYKDCLHRLLWFEMVRHYYAFFTHLCFFFFQKVLTRFCYNIRQQFLEPGESVIMISAVKKLRKITSKKVQLILTSKPRLIYVDPSKLIAKGNIIWSDNSNDLNVQISSPSHFKICTVTNTHIHTPIASHQLFYLFFLDETWLIWFWFCFGSRRRFYQLKTRNSELCSGGRQLKLFKTVETQ